MGATPIISTTLSHGRNAGLFIFLKFYLPLFTNYDKISTNRMADERGIGAKAFNQSFLFKK